ncbi:MAG: hypothetical protein ACRBFS_24305 [Aureispira sp.]
MSECRIENDQLTVVEWKPFTANARALLTPKNRIWISYQATDSPAYQEAYIKVSTHQNGFIVTVTRENEDGTPEIVQTTPPEKGGILNALKALDWPKIIAWTIQNMATALL